MTSPIERMIDAACGITEADRIKLREASVTMRCPTCGTTKRAKRHDVDPANAETIVFPCNECREGEGPEVQYLDKDGNGIPFP